MTRGDREAGGGRAEGLGFGGGGGGGVDALMTCVLIISRRGLWDNSAVTATERRPASTERPPAGVSHLGRG